MDADALAREVGRFEAAAAIEDAWTPPSSWYTAPAIEALERRAVFGRAWQPVARVEELDGVGAYQSGCFGGEPWLVVRDQTEQIRAFANTCRHKGREVVRGQGSAQQLVCGYHGWSYDLDGQLRSAPRVAGIRGFDRGAMALPGLAAQVWGPWVWINPSPQPAPLLADVAQLDVLLSASSWEQLRFVDRRTWLLECNWKVYVDNYLDGGYHVPHMHPSLAAQIDMATYRTDLFDRFSVQTADPVDAAPRSVNAKRAAGGAIYAWIYPNFMLNRYGPCMDTNHVVPLGPDRCRVDYEFYFADTIGSDAQRFIEQSIEQADLTQHEDIEICESVQRGLHSSSYDVGRYAPRVEQGEFHFHRLLAADLRRGLGL